MSLIATSQLADWFELGPYENTLWNLRLPSAHRLGHDPIASLAYLFAYGVMALMIVTGLGLAASEFQAGLLAGWLCNASGLEDVLGEPHEVIIILMVGFIGLHLAARVFHPLRGERVAQSMAQSPRQNIRSKP
ncbi:MAG TPA: cytochrome b/b6 domain-containing protein [Thiobacillus sp.]|nr:cytochrome b/b6 domain-containing protein [Thiobacillus sp.]HQT69396.1 cytochrome b/b6 domain-containing protein [Thiobacillus sp.]